MQLTFPFIASSPRRFRAQRFAIIISSAFFVWCSAWQLLFAAPVNAQSDVETSLAHAREQEKAGEYAAAGRIYQQALAANPGNLELLKRFGILQQTEMKFEDSIPNFMAVLAQDEKYPEVNFFLGVSYFGANNFPQAIASFERELATAKPHPRCRYYLALALQSSGRSEEAAAQFQKVAVENPKNADALYELARFYKNASIQAMDRLKALDQDSYQVHALMGEVYADEGRFADAIKEYQAALVKRPGAPGIHYAIGIAYWVQHRMDEAKPEFLEALRENPGDALTNLYLGDIAVNEERFAEALQYLMIAKKGQPEMPQVHLSLGKCYRGLEQPENAKPEFLAVIAADPTAPQPHYLLGQVYRQLGDAKASEKELLEFQRLSKSEKDKVVQHGPQN